MSDDRPTVPAPPPEVTGEAQLWLMVIADDRVDTFPLPRAGRIVIGRDADLKIDRESVSRSHAVLTIEDGPAIAIEDLGSSNGTHVAGRRVAKGVSTTIGFGEVFHIGTIALVVQRSSETVAAPVAPTDDPTLREVYALLASVAAGDLPVLIVGETGAGKEVAATALHRMSPRRDRQLLALNCGAFTETLLESELFGHERGAFSGAVAAKPGLLEAASGGTVFLDEVGELTPATQVKLLRVIEERAVRRVGAVTTRAIDVRFIAATNRDLQAEIARGAFRADLYYRLAGATVAIPPLRERVAAIEPLARAFAETVARRIGRPPPAIEAEALAQLRAYRWPGNIRELRNVVERAVLVANGAPIGTMHLPDGVRADVPKPGELPAPAKWWEPGAEGAERARIVAALDQAGGHQGKAAELLGISRRTLLNKLDALAIPRPRKG